MIDHINNCKYLVEKCQYCKAEIQKRIILNHLNVCEFKTVNCNLCGMILKEKDFGKHKQNKEECILYLKSFFENKIRDLENKLEEQNKNIKKIVDYQSQNQHLENRKIFLEKKIGKEDII